MENWVQELSSDPTVEQILKNLSTPQQNWSNFISDIEEKYNTTNLSQIKNAALSSFKNLFKSKSVVKSSPEWEDSDHKKIFTLFPTTEKRSLDPAADFSSSGILKYFLDSASLNADNDFYSFLIQCPVFNKVNTGQKEKSSGGSPLGNKSKPVTANAAPFTLHCTELLEFVKYCLHENSIVWYLLLLKLLFALEIKTLTLTESLHEDTSQLLEQLGKGEMLSEGDIKQVGNMAKNKEHLKSFQSFPRVLLLTGNANKCSRYEVQGKAAGLMLGLVVPHDFRFMYYEVTLKEKDSKLKGVRVGWALKSINLVDSFNLGDGEDSWVFDFETSRFLNGEYNKTKQDSKSEQATAAKQSFSEQLMRSLSAKSFDLDQDESMLGGLFVDGKPGNDKSGITPDQAQGKVESTGSLDSLQEKESELISTVGADVLNLGAKKGAESKQLIDWPNDTTLAQKLNVISCALDCLTGRVHFFGDGVYLGHSPRAIDFAQNPVSQLSVAFACGGNTKVEVNVGTSAFKFGSVCFDELRRRCEISDQIADFNDPLVLQSSFTTASVALNVESEEAASTKQESGESSCILVQNVCGEGLKTLTFELSFKVRELISSEMILFCCSPVLSGIIMHGLELEEQAAKIGIDRDGYLFLDVYNCERVKAVKVALNEWQHGALTYTLHRSSGKANVGFFLNGSIASTHEISNGKNSKPGKIHPRQVCVGGCMQNPAFGFKGEVNNIRLWSVAKSHDRIAPYLSRSKLAGNESDLLIFLPLEEGIGGAVRDYSNSKSSARKSEILTIRGNYRWVIQPHQAIQDRPIQDFLDSDRDISTDAAELLNEINNSKSSSFLAPLSRKIILGTEKLALKQSNLFKFQCSLPSAKALIGREAIVPILIHSFLLDLIRFNETEERSATTLIKSLFLAAFNLLETHIVRIADDLTASALIGHDIRSKLFIDILYFMSPPSNLPPAFAGTLRLKAVNFLISQLDFFFQDRFGPVRLLVILLEIDNQSQDSMSATLRRAISNSSSDKSVFYNPLSLDPLPAVSCMDPAGRDLLMQSLFSKISQSSYLNEVVGAELKPFRFDLNKGMLVFKRSTTSDNSKKRPYLGAIVKRGPDWQYGDEDGGESSYGVILRVGDTTSNKEIREVTIGWKNGFIESYRYDFNQTSLDRKYFDVEIVSSCEFDDDNLPTKDIESEKSIDRRVLTFTPLEVFNVLITGQNNEAISKRSVLTYIKEVATSEWQESRDLMKPINTLAAKLSAMEICNLFREFYDNFSLKVEKQNPLSFIGGVSSTAASGKRGLLKELTRQFFQYISHRETAQSDGSVHFLATLQYLLFVGNDFDASSENKIYDPTCEISTDFANELDQAKFTWDWTDFTIQQQIPDAASSTKAKMLSSDSKQESSSVIRAFTFERQSGLTKNLQIRNRSRCVDISLVGDREWNTLSSDQVMEYEKGIYRWYVRVKFNERRSHFMVGMSTSDLNPDEFLGQDSNSWGFSQSLESFHAGAKKKISTDGTRITPGAVLELTYNSYMGTFGLIEITPDSVNVLIEQDKCVLQNINGRHLYPAISLFSPGDVISLLTEASDISAARMKILLVQSSSSSSPTIKSSHVVNLGTPNDVVISYVFSGLETIQKLLSEKYNGNYQSLENLVPLVTHSLAQFTRWACPPIDREDELRALCLSNLQLIGAALSKFQKLEKEEFAKFEKLAKSLQLLILIILLLISRLIEGLMQNQKFLSLHRIERSNSMKKSSSERKDAADNSPTANHPIPLKTWIDNPLFAFGLKQDLGQNEEFIRLIRTKETRFDLFFRWLSCFDRTHPNFRKVGGESLDVCVRTIFLSIVYNCGLIQLTDSLKDILFEAVEKLGKIEGSIEEYFVKHIKAPPVLVRIWELAMKLKTWGKDFNVANQTAYEQLASRWYDRILFTFKFYPTLPEIPFHFSSTEITTCVGQVNSTLRSTLDLESWISENFSLLQKFIVDDVSTEGLEDFCKIIDIVGAKRSEGFKFVKRVLDSLSFDVGNGFKSVFIDSVAVLLKGSGISWSFGNSLLLKGRTKGWHYFDGLYGISSSVKSDLKGSFNLVFSALISEVADVSNAYHFYKLALLNSLALRVVDQDHELLVRVNFFPVLKELLDETLAEEAVAETSTDNATSARIISVTMKIFIWMALQVASSNSEAEAQGKLNSLSANIKLKKVVSGPGTLSDAVFDTLYRLLSDWSVQSDFSNKTQAIALESATLLHYVSRNERCIKILCRQEWIELLMQLICFSEMECKLKCILILCESLVRVSPQNLSVDISPCLLKLQLKDVADFAVGNPAGSVIQLLLYLIGQLVVGQKVVKVGSRLMTVGVIAEAVGLIRKLYLNQAWAIVVEDLMFHHLSKVEMILTTSSNLDEVKSSVFVGVLFTLGGQFNSLYPSQPVLLKSTSALTVGIVKSINESNDQVEVSAIKLKTLTPVETVKLHADELESISVNPDQLVLLSRSPFQASSITSRILSKFITIANCLGKQLRDEPLTGESKTEETAIEEKSEKELVGFENRDILTTFLHSTILKIFEELGQSSCVRGLELKQLIQTLDWDTIINLGEEETSTTSCQDIVFHDEWLGSSLSFLLGMKKTAPPKSTIEGKPSSNVENEQKLSEPESTTIQSPLASNEEMIGQPDEDVDPALVDSLESMGFQRKLCIAALKLRGFDPTEALNFLLSNGAELLESLNSDTGNDGSNHPEIADLEWELTREEKSEVAEEKFDTGNPTVFHCVGTSRKFLPFYAEPSFESERLGCVFPGDDIGVVEEREVGDNTWYRLSFSDFDGNNYHSTYGDEIYEIYVWVPRTINGEAMVEPGSYEGEGDSEFNEPRGDSLQIDRYYRIIGSNGALARDGIEVTSNEVASLNIGDIVHACEESFNSEGTIRLRLDSPIHGWISKIFGLVERITPEVALQSQPHPKIEIAEVKRDNEENEGVVETKLDQVETIEDSLEVLTGTDIYVRDDRFFGHRQGLEYQFSSHDVKADIQVIQAGRNRVSGVKTILGYYTNSFASTWQQVSSTMQILIKLRCRKLLSIFILRASANAEDFHFLLHKFNELHAAGGEEFVQKLHRVVRLLVFRGDYQMPLGFESVTANQLSQHARIGKGRSLEDSVGFFLLSLIKDSVSFAKSVVRVLLDSITKNLVDACDAKYADNSWTDCNFEDDLDCDVFQQPNVQYAAWASDVLMRTGDLESLKRLLHVWIRTVRGSSMSLKTISFSVLASVLRHLRANVVSHTTEIANFVFGIIPIRRLSRFASKRLWQELEDSPSFSRFIQAFIHFMSEVEITLNKWKLSSRSDELTQESVESTTSKIALRFDKPDSYVQLFPTKDISGPWTLEVTLRRQKHIPSHFISGDFALEKDNNSARTPSSKPSAEKLGISKLLQLLLGTSPATKKEALEANLLEPKSPVTPEATKKKQFYHPSYLVSSSKTFIKIQKGGRNFAAETLNDPLQATEEVNSDALCLSYGQIGSEEKSFDFIVPYDEWLKITLVADHVTGYMNLYINGKFIDSHQGVIGFPISTIGSNKANQSFAGEISQFKLWPFAKSAGEIEQRSDENSLINLKFDAGLNFGLYDSRGYLMACKPHGCSTVEIENLALADSYLKAPSFKSLDSLEVELTGTVTFNAVPGLSTILTKGMNEIITLTYKRSGAQNGTEEIVGLLTWVERNVRCSFVGEIFDNTKILIRTNAEHLYSGAPEKLAWLQDFIMEGTISSGTIQASCELIVPSDSVSSEEAGVLKLDQKKLPEVISLKETSGKQTQISLKVKKDAPDGQYVATFEVRPFPMRRKNLDVIDLTLYGIVADQGCYWMDFTIKSNSGGIALGFCTADALTHPDSSVEANDGTWTYSTGGSASNGTNLCECDVAEENDVVTLQLNAYRGIIRFFKNRNLLVDFEAVNVNAFMTQLENASSGLRPFVSLATAGDWVEYNGATKDGPITLSSLDGEEQVSLNSFLKKGAVTGYGLVSKKNGGEWWFGEWDRDQPIGHHVRIDNINSETLVFVEIRSFTNIFLRDGGIVGVLEDNAQDQMRNEFANFKLRFPQLFVSTTVQTEAPVSTGEQAVVETKTEVVADVVAEVITVSFIDSEARDIITHQVAPEETLGKAFNFYANNRGYPRISYIFQYNGSTLADETTLSSIGMTSSASITVSVKSHQCPIEKYGDPVGQHFNDSDAQYVVMIVYEGGATVRNGIEIEESSSLRTLKQGEVLEAFRKEHTNEGIGRFRIADGWISEKLRGGTEAPVSLILREKFDIPRKYRVIREDGAKVRAGARLDSDEQGICPQDTVVTIVEKRLIHFSDPTPTIRLKIVEPQEWIGWISDKSHLLEEIKDNKDPEFEAELRRRNRVRANRKLKKNMSSISTKPASFYVRVKGNVALSSETFFLLRKNRNSDSITFSDDLKTISCPNSGGGRSLVLGSRGFSHGVHYWEVQVNNAGWGSVFIGVAPEDAVGWNGFGFINYRAVQAFGSETLYGSYFGVGDKIGILLDMDRGTLSFFKDGEDFNLGKVVVINMGIAYHNVRKTAGRHSSSSTLYPCFGMKNNSDQLSISTSHWISEEGVNATKYLQNVLTFSQTLQNWIRYYQESEKKAAAGELFDDELTQQLYEEYLQKLASDEFYVESRPGIMVKVKCSIDEFTKLLGESFMKEFNISPGVVVNTVYGKGTLLGVSGERLWYSCERNLKKAWYWLGSEFKEIMQTARMTVSYINDVVETNQLPVPTLSLEQKEIAKWTKDEFQELLCNSNWDIAEDSALTKAINQLAYQIDQNPLYLSIHNVVSYFNSHKIHQLASKTLDHIIGRFIALCYLNRGIMIMLPLADLSTASTSRSLVSTNLNAFDESKRHFSITSNMKDLILQMKSCIFTSIKTEFWNTVVTESTAATTPPPDEYERPDEIREISVNRIQARDAVRRKDQLNFGERLKLSVFGQLMEGIQHWDTRAYRRSYVHMQDAGQPRAFFVRFIGEGVDDQGGPYRAVFQTAIGEEIMQLLSLLIPCANARDEIGDHRDRFVLNNTSAEFQENISKIFIHFGKVVGIACRHKILLPLPFIPLLWKALTHHSLDITDLQSVESSLMNSLQQIPSYVHEMTAEQIYDLLVQALVDCNTPQEVRILPEKARFIVKNAIRKEGLSLLSRSEESFDLEEPQREGEIVNSDEANTNESEQKPSNVLSTDEISYSIVDIIQLIQYLRLTSQNRLLQYFFEGLSYVLPVEIMSIFTAEELEVLFSGENTVDLEVLKKATEYESVTAHDSHIQNFWRALEMMNSEERSQFINFCSGRSRLPTSASEFPMAFKLTAPPANASKNPDNYLPIARTCFFSLSLPQYSSLEVCLAKLKYAINNTELMDADFIDRRGTSGWENIR